MFAAASMRSGAETIVNGTFLLPAYQQNLGIGLHRL